MHSKAIFLPQFFGLLSQVREYLGETRPLTVMFINLPDIRPTGALQADQAIVAALQAQSFQEADKSIS